MTTREKALDAAATLTSYVQQSVDGVAIGDVDGSDDSQMRIAHGIYYNPKNRSTTDTGYDMLRTDVGWKELIRLRELVGNKYANYTVWEVIEIAADEFEKIKNTTKQEQSVTLEPEQWKIVQEALYLYVHVNQWQDQGHNTRDIEDVSQLIFNETMI